MRRRLFRLLFEFVALSLPLSWLWMNGGKALYGRFFGWAATPIFQLLGATEPPNGYRDRFINYVPFVVLMLITPALSARRRALGTAVGLFVIFCGHLAFAWVANQAPRGPGGGRTAESFATLFPAFLVSDSLPFVLWAIFAAPFLKELGSHRKRRLGRPRGPSE